ncbi:thioredoxin domain-containing protein 9-like [Drosophila ficusphila]|uniref:thioredoxin domain-containing protein 9-like n=1 Tax=Drosophila ficusphila TaxID=30025 RepID=UPI001C88E3FD|nr:thioredoxin domain-containing protein 9-like [Drosophila ficusphila]
MALLLKCQKMKDYNKKRQEWLKNGHGKFTDLADEKKFFAMTKKSPNFVCHFYEKNNEQSKIVDKHLRILTPEHVEAKFCRLNCEKAPFLTKRLRLTELPTILLVKDGKINDFIVGFTDLGNRSDFTTEMMERRIGVSGIIEYKGNLKQPPNGKNTTNQKQTVNRSKKTKRGGQEPQK